MYITHGTMTGMPVTCKEHNNPTFVSLCIGNVVVPLCRYCFEDLKKKIEDVDDIDVVCDSHTITIAEEKHDSDRISKQTHSRCEQELLGGQQPNNV